MIDSDPTAVEEPYAWASQSTEGPAIPQSVQIRLSPKNEASSCGGEASARPEQRTS